MNILLNADLEAKVSDFGTIREAALTDIKTHFTTEVVIGTDTYMAPEYVKHGKVSVKLDAFAFGTCYMPMFYVH
jgi:serine/threonine protein kinase